MELGHAQARRFLGQTARSRRQSLPGTLEPVLLGDRVWCGGGDHGRADAVISARPAPPSPRFSVYGSATRGSTRCDVLIGPSCPTVWPWSLHASLHPGPSVWPSVSAPRCRRAQPWGSSLAVPISRDSSPATVRISCASDA